MLTPKCRPRDFRVSVGANSTKNRLCCFEWNLRRQNLAGFRGEVGCLAILLYQPLNVAVQGDCSERVFRHSEIP
jgi:hypothetical protein